MQKVELLLLLLVVVVVVVVVVVGRDRAAGTATRYGLDGPGIESLWEARFSAPVFTGHESHPVSYTMGTGSSPEGKTAGEWR